MPFKTMTEMLLKLDGKEIVFSNEETTETFIAQVSELDNVVCVFRKPGVPVFAVSEFLYTGCAVSNNKILLYTKFGLIKLKTK